MSLCLIVSIVDQSTWKSDVYLKIFKFFRETLGFLTQRPQSCSVTKHAEDKQKQQII